MAKVNVYDEKGEIVAEAIKYAASERDLRRENTKKVIEAIQKLTESLFNYHKTTGNGNSFEGLLFLDSEFQKTRSYELGTVHDILIETQLSCYEDGYLSVVSCWQMHAEKAITQLKEVDKNPPIWETVEFHKELIDTLKESIMGKTI